MVFRHPRFFLLRLFIFMTPSIAPSMIGRYFLGQSFNLWPARWRCSLSESSTSELKYRSTGSQQVLISWIATGRLGIVSLFSILARYRYSISTISASALCARCLPLSWCVRHFLIHFLWYLSHSISKDVIQSSIAFTNTNCCRKTAIPVAGIPGLLSFSAILVSK